MQNVLQRTSDNSTEDCKRSAAIVRLCAVALFYCAPELAGLLPLLKPRTALKLHVLAKNKAISILEGSRQAYHFVGSILVQLNTTQLLKLAGCFKRNKMTIACMSLQLQLLYIRHYERYTQFEVVTRMTVQFFLIISLTECNSGTIQKNCPF